MKVSLNGTNECSDLIIGQAVFLCRHFRAELGCFATVTDHIVGFLLRNAPHPIAIGEIARFEQSRSTWPFAAPTWTLARPPNVW